jgi:hypothetical protein
MLLLGYEKYYFNICRLQDTGLIVTINALAKIRKNETVKLVLLGYRKY